MSTSTVPQLPTSYKSPLEPERLQGFSRPVRPTDDAPEVPHAL
jgi:hypothetical protein